MAKLLFFNVPYYGHVLPTLPVTQELVKRGEEVTYYTTHEFEYSVQATGANYRIYKSLLTPTTRSPMAHMIDESYQVIPQLLEEARKETPDCIIYDRMCLWGRIISEFLQVPAILVSTTYAANEKFNIYKEYPPPTYLDQAFSTSLEVLCNNFSISPIEPLDIYFHTEELNIHFLTRRFHPMGDTFGEKYRFVGPSIAPRNESNHPNLNLKDKQPLIYISLGTWANEWLDFYRTCIAAFRGQQWQVVLSVGTKIDKIQLGELPDNIVAEAYVPQLDVLQYTDVLITHGGINTVMEALYYGVPMVVIPPLDNRIFNVTAKRVAELGLGVMVERQTLSVSALRQAVMLVANNFEYKFRTKQVSDEMRTTCGYKDAAESILNFLTKLAM